MTARLVIKPMWQGIDVVSSSDGTYLGRIHRFEDGHCAVLAGHVWTTHPTYEAAVQRFLGSPVKRSYVLAEALVLLVLAAIFVAWLVVIA